MITVTNLTKSYPSGEGEVRALRGIDLTVATGEFVCIMGQSGSGKSTLLTILGGMCHPSSGTVAVDGTPLYGPERRRPGRLSGPAPSALCSSRSTWCRT